RRDLPHPAVVFEAGVVKDDHLISGGDPQDPQGMMGFVTRDLGDKTPAALSFNRAGINKKAGVHNRFSPTRPINAAHSPSTCAWTARTPLEASVSLTSSRRSTMIPEATKCPPGLTRRGTSCAISMITLATMLA